MWAPLRSCLRPSPKYEYGKDGWHLHPSTGSTHAEQIRYVYSCILQKIQSILDSSINHILLC